MQTLTRKHSHNANHSGIWYADISFLTPHYNTPPICYTGLAIKNGLFLRVDNFAMADGRKAYMWYVKFPNFLSRKKA